MSEIILPQYEELRSEEFLEMLKKEDLEEFKTWLGKYNAMFYSVDNTKISLEDYTNFLRNTAYSLIEHGYFVLFKYLSTEYESAILEMSYAKMLYYSMVYVYNVQQNKSSKDYTTNINKAISFLSEIHRLDGDSFKRDINEYSVCKINPFQIAIVSGHIGIIEFLISNKFVDLNKEFEFLGVKILPIDFAVIFKKLEIVDFFKEKYGIKKSSQEQIDFVSGEVFNAMNNFLFWAVEKNNLFFTRFLIENCEYRNVNLNMIDEYGFTPLHYACIIKGWLPIVKYLIEKGVDKEIKDECGKTVLHYLCQQGNFNIVEYLMSEGVNKDVEDNEKMTPLHYACLNGHYLIAQYLIKNGVNVEAKNDLEKTPLHYACAVGCLPIVECLMSKGANKDVEDNEKMTPLHYACLNGHYLIAQYLIKNGANIEVKNKFGKTSLDYALERGYKEIVEILRKEQQKRLREKSENIQDITEKIEDGTTKEISK